MHLEHIIKSLKDDFDVLEVDIKIKGDVIYLQGDISYFKGFIKILYKGGIDGLLGVDFKKDLLCVDIRNFSSVDVGWFVLGDKIDLKKFKERYLEDDGDV